MAIIIFCDLCHNEIVDQDDRYCLICEEHKYLNTNPRISSFMHDICKSCADSIKSDFDWLSKQNEFKV